MSADLAKIEFTDEFISQLGDGPFKDGMKAAAERRKKKIAEIGYPAYRAAYDAETKRRLEAAEQHAHAKYAISLLKNSGLGEKFFTRTFDAFRATPHNETALDACAAIANGSSKKGVIISGPHGIGKTHLAAAVVIYMANHGNQVSFKNIVDLVDEVKDSFKTGTEAVINRILDASVIVLDDLGAEHVSKDNNWIDSLLYKIVNHAYEGNKTLVITTNLDEFDFAKRYNPRIVSRLHEMCDWIAFSERDARMEGFETTEERMPFKD